MSKNNLTYKKLKETLIKKLSTFSNSPEFEAGEIISYVSGIEKRELVFKLNDLVEKKTLKKANKVLKKRKKGMPLQYILGEWEFYSLPFYVGRGVLIPRPDTEVLAEQAINYLKNIKDPTVYDLCSGSGALAIAIKHNCQNAKVWAVEKSLRAFRYLKKNTKLNNVDIILIKKSIFKWKPKDKADLIVSNPPYITEAEMKKLSKEVKNEPKMALYGGDDGLKFYKFIAKKAKDILNVSGKIMFEIGYEEADAVTKILKEQGFSQIETFLDIEGKDRVVTATLKN